LTGFIRSSAFTPIGIGISVELSVLFWFDISVAFVLLFYYPVLLAELDVFFDESTAVVFCFLVSLSLLADLFCKDSQSNLA